MVYLQNILCQNLKEFSNGVFCILLPRPFDKLDMTMGQGQWPRVTWRTGWNQCALLSEKGVDGTLDTLSQRINYSTWKSNLNPYSTWNSNLNLVFNLDSTPISMGINLGECTPTTPYLHILQLLLSCFIHAKGPGREGLDIMHWSNSQFVL